MRPLLVKLLSVRDVLARVEEMGNRYANQERRLRHRAAAMLTFLLLAAWNRREKLRLKCLQCSEQYPPRTVRVRVLTEQQL